MEKAEILEELGKMGWYDSTGIGEPLHLDCDVDAEGHIERVENLLRNAGYTDEQFTRERGEPRFIINPKDKEREVIRITIIDIDVATEVREARIEGEIADPDVPLTRRLYVISDAPHPTKGRAYAFIDLLNNDQDWETAMAFKKDPASFTQSVAIGVQMLGHMGVDEVAKFHKGAERKSVDEVPPNITGKLVIDALDAYATAVMPRPADAIILKPRLGIEATESLLVQVHPDVPDEHRPINRVIAQLRTEGMSDEELKPLSRYLAIIDQHADAIREFAEAHLQELNEARQK